MTKLEPAIATAATGEQYSLHDDLARFCLPEASRDANRKYAYANSICFLFIVIGLIGINPPHVKVREIEPLREIVPVVITPPPDEKQPEPEELKPDEKPPELAELPQIATVVAADVKNVNFAVPVKGPVIVTEARFAPPPPAVLPKPAPPKAVGPPKPIEIRSDNSGLGRTPWPSVYPREALLNKQQGTVGLQITVDPTGAITAVEVRSSSGYSVLDREARDWIRRRWQFPPGEARVFTVSFEYNLK
jgi:protein TonB